MSKEEQGNKKRGRAAATVDKERNLQVCALGSVSCRPECWGVLIMHSTAQRTWGFKAAFS
jgi:hypothetical protein